MQQCSARQSHDAIHRLQARLHSVHFVPDGVALNGAAQPQRGVSFGELSRSVAHAVATPIGIAIAISMAIAMVSAAA